MARLFTASGDAVVFPTCEFTTINRNWISFWYWPLFSQNDNTDHFICDMPMHFGYGRFYFGKFADNKFGGGITYVNTDNRILANAGTYTLNQNAWNCVYCEFGGAGGSLYLNGTKLAEGGSGLNPWAGYSFTIGNNSARNAPASGAIGEMYISGCGGNISHSGFSANSAKIASLGVGLLPDKIQWGENQLGMEHIFPLWGVHNPEIDLGPYAKGRVGVVYGTTRFLPGPPVQPRSSRFWKMPIAYGEPFIPPDPELLGGPNAVLVIPDEGELIAQQVLLGAAEPEDLWLRLFVNDYEPNELSTESSFVEPDGYNYAPITLTKGVDWTFEAGTPTPSVATSWSRFFELTGPVGDVYGFWVQGKVSRKVYWAARYTTGPQHIGAVGGDVVIPPRVGATSA